MVLVPLVESLDTAQGRSLLCHTEFTAKALSNSDEAPLLTLGLWVNLVFIGYLTAEPLPVLALKLVGAPVGSSLLPIISICQETTWSGSHKILALLRV